MLSNICAYGFPIIHNFQNAINRANQENTSVTIEVLDIEILVEPGSDIHELLSFWEEQLDKRKKK